MRANQSHDAEQALIGAVILGGDSVFDRAAVLPDDLANLRHMAIWRAMCALRTEGKSAGDVQLIADKLAGTTDAVGGPSYLAELTRLAVPDHIEEYSAIIRTTALTRRIEARLNELLVSPLEGPELLAEVIDRMRDLTRCVEDTSITVGEAVVEAYAELTEAIRRSQEGEAAWGLPTGFAELDQLIGGLQRGVLTILAGRPSMGKSALARKIAEHIARRGDGVHVFTPEDSRRTYALRETSDEAQVALDKFWSLKLSPYELEGVRKAVDRIEAERLPWLIDDTTDLSALDIGMRVRKRKDDNRTSLVVVDYVQLLTEADIPAREVRLQVDTSTKRLGSLARSEDIAVLMISQLSRACETRKEKDKRPRLSDLRESGGLEQAANVVMFVYRDEYYNEETDDKGIGEIILGKNKNGPTGTIKARWDAETATHRPLSRREEPEAPVQGSWT